MSTTPRPADLAEIIATHKALFGGFTMMAEDPEGEPPAYVAPASQADLDKIIADRLSRERAKYSDYSDLKAKAAEYDKAQDAAKTELQKAIDRAEAAEEKAAEYETRDQVAAWAKEIVKDSKVPASALRGSTKEELQAHFAELDALIPKDNPNPKPGAVGPYIPPTGEGAASAPIRPGDRLRAAYQASSTK